MRVHRQGVAQRKGYAIIQRAGVRLKGGSPHETEKLVHPVNGEVPPVKGRPWKLPHYANRGKTSSSGGELASARSCFSTVRTALGKLRITGLLARLDDCSEFSTVPTASATAADYMDKRTGSRFGIRKVPTTSPPPHFVSDHRKTYFFGLSPTGHRSRQPRLWRGIGGNGSVQRLNRPQIEHRQRVGERRGAGELIVPPP